MPWPLSCTRKREPELGRQIFILGQACRLPGASSIDEFRTLLNQSRCAVGTIPDDRWNSDLFHHPHIVTQSKSYTFAAGVLDDVWGFDLSVFNLSPRELTQMDPQQRLLLKVVWEAIEDAQIDPARMAGTRVGVYVGTSAVDHATALGRDISLVDPYMMTGNTMSLVANRVSHAFDLRGPSFIVDTACSSSLVALDQARIALARGDIDTAIVAGVNLLLAPNNFIGFSAARMLSPKGLCQAFSDKADGYVRAEGCVALVLHASDSIPRRARAIVLDSETNADGYTLNVALPSPEGQLDLLRTLYDRAEISPEDLCYVEAHGTGTLAGDPVEAQALGRALGQKRQAPLPIGSVKSNIGHLEPASGLAGLAKTLIALQDRHVPASLHADTLNPAIDFKDLNLTLVRAPLALDKDGPLIAGISSFGFGGVNSHCIISTLPALQEPHSRGQDAREARQERLFVTSAFCDAALRDLAASYGTCFDRPDAMARGGLIDQAWAGRGLYPRRLGVIAQSAQEAAAALLTHAAGTKHPAVVTAESRLRDRPSVFAFSGNGAQYAGMCRLALEHDDVYRDFFAQIDAEFTRAAGWSLRERLDASTLEADLAEATVAQALLFADQAAQCVALRARGLMPSAVIGHSGGEVAAAWACGALSLSDAIHLVIHRSRVIAPLAGRGTMAALQTSPVEAGRLLAEFNASFPTESDRDALGIAAMNSPRSVSVVGPSESLRRFAQWAKRQHRLACVMLSVNYPYHSAMQDPLSEELISALDGLTPSAPQIPFFSSTRGACLDGADLGADYWWQNMRQPVRFHDAVRAAVTQGFEAFVEIGPQPVLANYLTDSIGEDMRSAVVTHTLARNDPDSANPIARAAARAVLSGCRLAEGALFVEPSGTELDLPAYPWQDTPLRAIDSPAIRRIYGTDPDYHPLLGTKVSSAPGIWKRDLDDRLLPVLGDHRVGREVLLPATAFAEMAYAAATIAAGNQQVEISDLDISSPVVLSAANGAEVQTVADAESRRVQMKSRPRLSAQDYRIHMQARFVVLSSRPEPPAEPAPLPITQAEDQTRRVGFLARYCGLNYGPAFQGIAALRIEGDRIEATLRVGLGLGSRQPVRGFDPVQLDCLLHGLIVALRQSEFARQNLALIPVRMGRLNVFRPGDSIVSGRLEIRRWGAQSLLVDLTAFGGDGAVVLRIEGLRLQSLYALPPIQFDRHAFHMASEPCLEPGAEWRAEGVDTLPAALSEALAATPAEDEAALLIDAATHQAIWAAFQAASNAEGMYHCQHLPHPAEPMLLHMLAQFGLASPTEDASCWQVAPDCALPHSEDVALSLLAEHPDKVAQLAVLLRLPEALSCILAAGDSATLPDPETLFGREALRNLDLAYRRSAQASLASCLPPVLSQCVTGAPATGVLAADETALKALLAQDPVRPVSRLVTGTSPAAPASNGCRDIALGAAAALDLLVVSDPAFLMAEGLADRLRSALAPSARIMLPCRPAMALALAANASAENAQPAAMSPERVVTMLQEMGFATRHRSPLSDGLGAGELLVAGRAATQSASPAPSSLPQDAEIVWAEVWAGLHGPCEVTDGPVCLIAPQQSTHPLMAVCTAATDAELADAILALTAHVAQASAEGRALVTILPEGAQYAGSAPADPLRHALWALLRTVRNEYPAVRITSVDPAPMGRIGTQAMMQLLERVVGEAAQETELVLTPDGVQALRVTQGAPIIAPPGRPEALRLERPVTGRLDDMKWHRVARPGPAAGEVEIEIAATGLNYRDVMWAMGLLPEEALETGFAGPTLGLECAGRITRIGADVQSFAVGDPVLAFGPACLASHLCIEQDRVHKLPGSMPLAQAAALPVAYFTAHYALVTLGRLRKGETVLIHGGAGGVGLAAISVAQDIGARVIATAGSPVKQDLLRKLGVAHVLSSRSTDFAGQIRALTGGAGVDMVLNALAGQAMEQSLNALRPFGRFLELGKQDYYANTGIGLRALKDNISYFGVDIDTLLAIDPDAARDIFTQVMAALAEGRYSPLPYTLFEGAETVEAFRLMQRSGHLGKVVIAPPSPDRTDQNLIERYNSRTFTADPEGWHVIAGGLGGIGIETAQWLHLYKGAGRIALLGRRGEAPPELAGIVERLREGLIELRIIACDITDRENLEQVLASLRESAPLASVFHAAMLLEDRTLANLDRASLERTLPVKTLGLRNLDLATRQDALECFVAFTSLAALIGNHGQAAYVAANAHQEALIQTRHQMGMPALALGLGAVTDAGYLTRDKSVAKLLDQMAGNVPFPVSAVLHALERLLALPGCGPCITITPMRWSAISGSLPVLRHPSHALLRQLGEAGGSMQSSTDLRSDLLALPREKAEKRLAAFVRAEIAAILRVSADSLPLNRPVSQLGMDSLMGVEFGLAMQGALGDDLPMLTMSDNLTVTRIAQTIVQHLHAGAEQDDMQDADAQRSLRALQKMHGLETGTDGEPR